MRERVGEPDGRIRLQQDIGDPHFGKAAIEGSIPVCIDRMVYDDPGN